MGSIQNSVKLGLVVLALAACTTGAPQHVEPGTSSAPDKPWTPPARVGAPASGRAPEAGAPKQPHEGPITLAEVIDTALSNNPDTRTAWLEARAAEAGLGSARSAYLPEVDVLAGATRSRGPTPSSQSATTIAPSLALTYLL